MTINTECWMKDSCFKYKNNNCLESFCPKQFKMNCLYEESLLTESQRKRVALKPDYDGTDRDIFVKLKSIETNIENFINEGNNLYLYSSITGNGKSAWATRLIQSYFNKIWHKAPLSCKALFVSVPKFMVSIKEDINTPNDYVRHIKNNIINADIVVWDDIATKCATQFEHDSLFNLIDLRFNEKKTNIFTSNISPASLTDFVGERLASRINGYCDKIEFKGFDKRGVK